MRGSTTCLLVLLAAVGCGDDAGAMDVGVGVDSSPPDSSTDSTPDSDAMTSTSGPAAEACRLFSEGPTAMVDAGFTDDRAARLMPSTVTTVTLDPTRTSGWLDLGTIDATDLFVFLSADESPAVYRVLTQVAPSGSEAPLGECPASVARYIEYRSIDPNPGYKLAFQLSELDSIDVLFMVGDP